MSLPREPHNRLRTVGRVVGWTTIAIAMASLSLKIYDHFDSRHADIQMWSAVYGAVSGLIAVWEVRRGHKRTAMAVILIAAALIAANQFLDAAMSPDPMPEGYL